jgi:hypothetical protein
MTEARQELIKLYKEVISPDCAVDDKILDNLISTVCKEKNISDEQLREELIKDAIINL